MCDMTHSYMWNDSCTYVTWPMHTCDMTHSYMWHDSFICVTWLIHICGLTYPYVTWMNEKSHVRMSHVAYMNESTLGQKPAPHAISRPVDLFITALWLIHVTPIALWLIHNIVVTHSCDANSFVTHSSWRRDSFPRRTLFHDVLNQVYTHHIHALTRVYTHQSVYLWIKCVFFTYMRLYVCILINQVHTMGWLQLVGSLKW